MLAFNSSNTVRISGKDIALPDGSEWGRQRLTTRTLFGKAMRFDFSPTVDATDDQASQEKKDGEYDRNRKPLRGRGYAFFGFCWWGMYTLTAGKVVFGEQAFFIKAKISCDRANETAAKYAAGKPGPIFIFERFEKARADARRSGNLFERNFA